MLPIKISIVISAVVPFDDYFIRHSILIASMDY